MRFHLYSLIIKLGWATQHLARPIQYVAYELLGIAAACHIAAGDESQWRKIEQLLGKGSDERKE